MTGFIKISAQLYLRSHTKVKLEWKTRTGEWIWLLIFVIYFTIRIVLLIIDTLIEFTLCLQKCTEFPIICYKTRSQCPACCSSCTKNVHRVGAGQREFCPIRLLLAFALLLSRKTSLNNNNGNKIISTDPLDFVVHIISLHKLTYLRTLVLKCAGLTFPKPSQCLICPRRRPRTAQV